MQTYSKVFDGANRRIRGLWKRNGTFYVQTTITDASNGLKKVTRLPIEDAKTEADAKEKMFVLLDSITKGQGIAGKLGPEFKAYREHYHTLNVKADKTKANEDHFLKQWEKFLGEETRITSITPTNVMAYRTDCLKRNLAARTINLHVKALKQLLLMAMAEGYINKLPFDGVKRIKEEQHEKELYEPEQIHAICTEALTHPKTGKQFADFIKLSMYSGGRMTEVLNLKWSNVDWDNRQLVFQGDTTKNSKSRRVDFSKNLEKHLTSMKETKTSEVLLFPSNRTDNAVVSFKTTLNAIRKKLGFDTFTFHSLRHFFISQCVMKGIDFMTIAKWCGHQDGGVLIGRVYGHLNNTHMKLQAAKLDK